MQRSSVFQHLFAWIDSGNMRTVFAKTRGPEAIATA
jgi:hypothetical protein